ncbi:MAG: ribonuclease HII [Firmicutes bacterium]|nr:ribonuclease HII [Bacillota bacterium]
MNWNLQPDSLKEKLALERARFEEGHRLICGVDEAGRGPLAGPVVAAAVILPFNQGELVAGVDDSKKLTPARREELNRLICQKHEFGIGVVSAEIIDRINILQATFLAMRKALSRLKTGPDIVLVDGNHAIPGCGFKQQAVVDGDALSYTVAAASIVAKVFRDRLMEKYDLLYPEYGFARHKGYGTPEHLAALARCGPCSLHRYSYRPILEIAGSWGGEQSGGWPDVRRSPEGRSAQNRPFKAGNLGK